MPPRVRTASPATQSRKPRPTLTPATPPEKKASAKKPAQKKIIKKVIPKKIPVVPTYESVPVAPIVTPPSKPLEQKLPAATLAPQKNQKLCMSSAQCLMYGGLICLAGTVALGLLLSILVLAPLGTRIEQSQKPIPPQEQGARVPADTETQSDTQNSNGFYGTLLSKDNGVLIVKELNPSLPLEKKSADTATKTFAVSVSDKTGYTHQRPRDGQDVSAPLFTPEAGTFDNLKTGMYVFIATADDTSQTETVTASHVLYSENSPFAE
ncbi:MAG: hypothetical protein Q8P56_06680 [Candidatus Uhrbacteria bacterium]|nr:hypothetical protein [Candidatus Uhrbacteria bacterium]